MRFLLFFVFLLQPLEGRELMVQHACQMDPTLVYCSPAARAKLANYEKQKKLDVFIDWALTAARDAQDIEDLEIDELGTMRRKPENVEQYCVKYDSNYKSYCSPDKLQFLEKLLEQFCFSYKKNCDTGDNEEAEIFPTPKPLITGEKMKETEESGKAVVVDSTTTNRTDDFCTMKKSEFETECGSGKSPFQSQEFCGDYRKKCGKVETIDEMTEKIDSLEDFDPDKDFKEKPKSEAGAGSETGPEPGAGAEVAEGQGAKSDEVTKYCTNYVENYNFFCAGETAPEHEKFCESYKKNCPDSAPFKESGSFLGGENSETQDTKKSTYLYKGSKKEYCQKFSVNFEYYCKGTIENAEIYVKFCPSYKKACPDEANPDSPKAVQKTKSSGDDEEFPDFDRPGKIRGGGGKAKQRRVRKKRECTPDCDQRIFKHCTVACKCDYSYPAVQKFCNPPPLPLFLNTCRLWYHGCPKYEQYHYASQFVYSKAEKGKVLEGPKLQTTFQLLTPNGQAVPYKPTRFRRSSDMVMWPEEEGLLQNTIELSLPENSTFFWNSPLKTEEALTKIIDLVPPPPIPRNSTLFKKDDAIVEAPNLPRNKKTTGGQSVPVFSDSVFTNAVNEYNSYTDSRGILHRPRSRSPFTKPGLWEPNPDDPHNRDHANKYYYAPKSVNVDWLQGQLAWGAHWAVPAAGVGGTDGFSALHFPSIGTFLNIPDDYD